MNKSIYCFLILFFCISISNSSLAGKGLKDNGARVAMLSVSVAVLSLMAGSAIFYNYKNKSENQFFNEMPDFFNSSSEGFECAKSYMEKADIIYLAIGAGYQKDQVLPEFLERALDSGKSLLILSFDPTFRVDLPVSENIKHIHIRSKIFSKDAFQFVPSRANQKLVIFDGTIAEPSGNDRCCKYTQAMIEKNKNNKDVICWIQTLGVIKDLNELTVKSNEADDIAKQLRMRGVGNGHMPKSLNHTSGQIAVFDDIRKALQ